MREEGHEESETATPRPDPDAELGELMTRYEQVRKTNPATDGRS